MTDDDLAKKFDHPDCWFVHMLARRVESLEVQVERLIEQNAGLEQRCKALTLIEERLDQTYLTPESNYRASSDGNFVVWELGKGCVAGRDAFAAPPGVGIHVSVQQPFLADGLSVRIQLNPFRHPVRLGELVDAVEAVVKKRSVPLDQLIPPGWRLMFCGMAPHAPEWAQETLGGGSEPVLVEVPEMRILFAHQTRDEPLPGGPQLIPAQLFAQPIPLRD